MAWVLEEIFWKDGKYFDSHHKEVIPKPIGKIISELKVQKEARSVEQILLELAKEDVNYQEVNSYEKMINKNTGFFGPEVHIAVKFYRI